SLLIRYIRLTITFLFVEPRFRYPFLSLLPHDSQAWESLLGSPVAGAHRGLTPQIYDMPVVLQKNDDLNRRFAKINMHFFFFLKITYLFFIVFYCRADPSE
ncbi:hypothetical protein, partial [Streptococcus pneumoniae]|uniref:hypothetical protein n=1 Tax=Streptococcus pneumoniae TaxID=1313 RepID=UPI001C5D6D28